MRDFLSIIFKHKHKILIIFLTTVITVTVGSFLLPPTYEAKSSLMVKFGRENIYRPEVGDDTKPTISFQSFNQEEAISSEIQILTSKDLMEKVINTLGVDKIYPDMARTPPKKMTPLEAAILKFEKKVSVENIRKSNVIEVSFQHKNPEIAAQAVNQLVEFYKEKHLQVLSSPKSSFLENQLTTYRQTLKESENNLEAFKQKYKVFSLDEQRSLLLKQRVDLDTSLKTALLSLQLREQELLGKYAETSRVIANIREEINLVKEFLKEQEKDLAGAEPGSMESQGAAIKQQLNKLDKEIRTLDLREKELKNLKREVATNEKNYKTYLNKSEEARISDDMDRRKMANIAVIQKAIVPAKPIKPRKRLNIALGIILGAMSGLGFAFFSEHISEGLSTPESAERLLDLPVLTTISYFNGVHKTGSTLLRWGFGTTAAFLLIAGVLWISPFKDTLLSLGEQSVSTMPEAVVLKNDEGAEKIDLGMNIDYTQNADGEITDNEEVQVNNAKQMLGNKTISVRVSVANIRMKPSIESKRMGQTFKNDQFLVLDEQKDDQNAKWYQVPYNGKEGWILGWLVETAKIKEKSDKEHIVIAMKEASDEEIGTAVVPTVSVRVSVANIRTKPSIESKRMGQTFKNDQFLVLDEQKDDQNAKWYQVPYNGKEGWILGWLVETAKIKEKSDKEHIVTAMKEASDEEIGTAVVPTVEKPALQKRIKIPRWAINISSTTVKDDAINLLDKVNKNGYNAYMTRFNHKSKLWHRVRVGFFPTKNDARMIGQDIKKEYAINDYWIVKAPKSEILKHKRK